MDYDESEDDATDAIEHQNVITLKNSASQENEPGAIPDDFDDFEEGATGGDDDDFGDFDDGFQQAEQQDDGDVEETDEEASRPVSPFKQAPVQELPFYVSSLATVLQCRPPFRVFMTTSQPLP